MNTVQQSTVMLLKSAITGKPQPLPEDFSMEQVLLQSKPHHIPTMLYEGAVLCGIDPQDPAMQTLFPQYCKAIQVSARQMREVDKVLCAFEENGIDYMPLKGCRMKPLYPKPELRLMGDADILIRVEQYEKIVPVMQALGFAEKYESDHELVWESDGLFLELHKCVIPSYNKDFYAYFGEGWERAKRQNGMYHAMSEEDELIYLFTHFAKHYRDGGIGCRYVVDLWVFLRANPDLDEAYILAQLQVLQLQVFYQNIRRLIDVWFEDAAGDEKTDFLSDFIFTSGSWGGRESNIISVAVRDSKSAPQGVSAKLLYLWQLAFPRASAIEEHYTILKKHPWLLPLIWIWRPISKILFDRRTLRREQKKIKALKQEKLDERQQALQYVGLDYNF